MKQLGFYFDQSRCIGCYACVFGCKIKNHLEPDVFWRRMVWVNEDNSDTFISLSCLHCASPPCVKACPVNAIIKRDEDGVVLVETDKCLGKDKCKKCLMACPYDVPQFGSATNAKMNKCDLCLDMLREDKKPFCVMHCSHKALDFGFVEKLKIQYGYTQKAMGFKNSKSAKPSFIVKSKFVK